MKKKKNKTNAILRVRKTNSTQRDRLSTMVIVDKKKRENKNQCRRKIDYT